MEYKVGNICRHEYRRTGFYKVVRVQGTKVSLKRCRKDATWSLAGQRSVYIVDANDPKLSLWDKGCYVSDITDRNAPDVQNTGAVKDLESLSVWECSGDIKNEFRRLQNAMSPENVWCDGEASASQARRTMVELNRKWALLEEYIGFKVKKEF